MTTHVGLTEEQLATKRLAEDFAEKELAPNMETWDANAEFSQDAWRRMLGLGLSGLMVPEKYGGAAMDNMTCALVMEALSYKGKTVWTSFLGLHYCVEDVLLRQGTEEQKQKWLAPLVAGKHIAAFGLTEPNMGSDAASLETTADLQGKEYVLNGTKRFISHAGEADVYLVMARTNRKIKGARGVSSFMVEKGVPGFTFGRRENKMGASHSHTGDLEFSDCRVPVENRIGAEGTGYHNALSGSEIVRLCVAAAGVGIAQAALDEAVAYAKERRAFGAPIATFQGLQFMMADMETEIEAARQLTYYAARVRDSGQPSGRAVSMAKMYATDMSMRVTTDAVQLFGGYGYTKDYPVERLMREAKLLQIVEGTSQVQKIVISQNLLGRDMVKLRM